MTVAIIDGDVVAYMACENRYLGVIDRILKGTGKETVGITDLEEHLADRVVEHDDGLEVPSLEEMRLVTLEPVLFTPEEDELYFAKAWHRFQDLTLSISEFCFADSYLMAVKGDGCFREDIYPEYKANRIKPVDKRNYFVPRLRQKAVELNMATAAHGMEADDQIRIWQEELSAKGEDYVICSVDKDLKCMPGHHLNIKKNIFSEVTPEQAMRFYYEQIIQGDPTDNIKGVPRVGPKGAAKFLKDCVTEADFQATVIEVYQAAFGEDWKKELTLNGRLIHLLKQKDDVFTVDMWAMKVDETKVVVDADNKALWQFPSDNPVATEKPVLTINSPTLKEPFTLHVPPTVAPQSGGVPLPVFNPNWGKKNVK